MIALRKSKDRGFADHGWLKTYHSFSFADYHDPKFMGFRSLRVINEDYIEGGNGFGTHAHHDMEILTYIVSGSLEHKDSMGNGSVITPGELQYMSAGSGVTHSEFNPSPTATTHLLQIWIIPEARGLTPRYDQKHFAPETFNKHLNLVASREGAAGAIAVQQDIKLYAAKLKSGDALNYELAPGRHCWIQLISGSLSVNKTALSPGDGAALSDEKSVSLLANANQTEFLLFDLN
jgi:redox-sensitive bicupin YhaK (pirin superfamily)